MNQIIILNIHISKHLLNAVTQQILYTTHVEKHDEPGEECKNDAVVVN
jgi:hypothetical protein